MREAQSTLFTLPPLHDSALVPSHFSVYRPDTQLVVVLPIQPLVFPAFTPHDMFCALQSSTVITPLTQLSARPSSQRVLYADRQAPRPHGASKVLPEPRVHSSPAWVHSSTKTRLSTRSQDTELLSSQRALKVLSHRPASRLVPIQRATSSQSPSALMTHWYLASYIRPSPCLRCSV